MILILGHRSDGHAQAVAAELARLGQTSRIFDTGEFGRGALFRFGSDGSRSMVSPDGEIVDLHRIAAVWSRRVNRPSVEAFTNPDDRNFATAEWREAIDAFLLGLDAAFVNPISAQLAATKPRQLEVASLVGLRIPETLVTNDAAATEDFVARHRGRIVHKAMTPPRNMLLETRRWNDAATDALPHLVWAPAIFQELVEGPSDIRATVCGDRILTALIQTSSGRADLDSRLDLDAPCEQHELPDEVAARLLDFMGRLSLPFGTVDMKLTDDGDYVFFEVNPQGQFLYIEALTGLPITAELARLLLRTARPQCADAVGTRGPGNSGGGSN